MHNQTNKQIFQPQNISNTITMWYIDRKQSMILSCLLPTQGRMIYYSSKEYWTFQNDSRGRFLVQNTCISYNDICLEY